MRCLLLVVLTVVFGCGGDGNVKPGPAQVEASSGGGAGWPQWRGPNRDGIARQARLPRAWPRQPPKPLWRVAVGEGCSSPVVAGGDIYVMGRADDQEMCLCLDANTGRERWRHAYPQPFRPHPDAQAFGSGPKSTPTLDGDGIYTLGIEGKFHCLDAQSGRVRWQHDLAAEYWGVVKDENWTDYDGWRPICGVTASPLVVGDHVVVPVGGKKGGAMTAFDKHTGRPAWKSLEDRSSYASPVAAELAGVVQVVGLTGQRVAGFGAADGQLLWDYPYPPSYEDTIVTPVVAGDLVVLCSRDRPAAALRLEPVGGRMRPTVAWENKNLRSYLSTPVAYEGHLYGLADSGRLVCIALATGKTAWVSVPIGRYATLVVADGQLLVFDNDGELHVLEPTPKGFTRRARLKLGAEGETWAHPAVAGTRLYLKDKGYLMAYEFAPSK